MSGNPWLARLKNELPPASAPAEPTKPVLNQVGAAFVGFAGATLRAGTELFGAQSTAHDGDTSELCDQYARAREVDDSPDFGGRVLAADAYPDAARVRSFVGRGLAPDIAEALADRLAIRDVEFDDRRLCLECSYLGPQGRCLAAAAGRLVGASPRLEPVQTVLHRCEGFGLRKGLV